MIENTDLSVNISGVTLKNPVIAASGTFGYGREYSGIFDVSCLGGICTKALTLYPRAGNSGMRIWETPGGLLNSIGLENPGIPYFLEKELPFLLELKTVIIANLSGSDTDEYLQGAALLNKSGIDMIELNISCPNVKMGGMAFGLDAQTAGSLVSKVRCKCSGKPLIVKLSPNAPSLSSVAAACVKAGADALSLVNTFKAMAIDTAARKPVFNNISAGLSGPAVKPIALRMVWELFDDLEEKNAQVPIIGIGGISSVNDALEFLMAGSCAVQIGSAVFVNPNVMTDIISGIQDYMKNNKMTKLNEISIRNTSWKKL